jgi:hypothetical protein
LGSKTETETKRACVRVNFGRQILKQAKHARDDKRKKNKAKKNTGAESFRTKTHSPAAAAEAARYWMGNSWAAGAGPMLDVFRLFLAFW